MELMVRRLLKMSVTFRNLSFSQIQYLQISRYSRICKDNASEYNSKNLKDDTVFKIIQDLSPKNLLNYIDCNKHQIQSKHIMIALSSLQNFYENKTKSVDKVCEKIDLKKLCTSLEAQIRELKPAEVIEALNMLNLMKVKSSNFFVITLLNHLNSFEKLSFQEISRLSALLANFETSQLTNETTLKLKQIFSQNFIDLNTKNLTELIYSLNFATDNIKNQETIDVIAKCIENYSEKFEFKEALNILNLLTSIKNLPCKLIRTIQHIKEVIIDNIHELEHHQVQKIIENISVLISSNHEEFYDDAFIDELVQKIIYENWNFLEGNTILQCLNSIRHVQMDLLDYLSAKLYEDQSNLTLDMDLLHPLVTGIAMADYKPVFWDAIQEAILNVEISKVEHIKLCHYVYDLACLECFEPRLLHEIFSTKLIMSEEHQKILLKLYQIVKILYPTYDGPWPQEDFLKPLKSSKNNNDFPLLSALEKTVGGDAYILTNVKTSLEHYIDHVLIMKKSGYPLATNSYGTIETDNITYIEDLRIPPGTQTYLILYAQPEWYARNTQRILGPYSSFIKTLETMSYTVISIDGKKWLEMPLNKQISYIMQAIKLRFEPDSISTAS